MKTDQYIGIDNDENIISVKASLVAKIHEEKPGLFVSYCPALDLYSQGDSVEDAKEMIIEATELFIRSCLKRNTLNEVLTECGFYSVDAEAKEPVARRAESPASDSWTVRFPAELPVLVAHAS